MLTRKIIVGMVLLLLVQSTYADEIYVPGDYSTIQAAIDSASAGDTILVSPDTYYETINFSGKAITLQSTDPNDWDVVAATVIDGNGATNGVLFNSGEGSGSVLTGLTVTGDTYGIYCNDTSPTISKCIIRDNSVRGIDSYDGAPIIINNKIYNNGDVSVYFHSPTTGTIVSNNLIHDANYGIIILDLQGTATVSNNTLVRITKRGISRVFGTSPTITNCIVWDCNDDLYGCSVTYSCIQDGDTGTGNISSDPCFADADANNFHLSWNSPCINKGDPNGNYDGQLDIDYYVRVIDSHVDIGADETCPPDAHWWKLDETSGTTTYDSINTNNGVFNGNDPCWTTGKFNGAVDFNGVNDYFSVASLDSAYDAGSIFTVAGWFKASQSEVLQTIVGQWSQDGGFYYGWQVLVESNKVVAKFGGDVGMTEITGIKNVTDGEWHHFALANNGSSSAVLYVDGELDGTYGPKYMEFYGTKFRIGDGSYGNGTLEGGPFNGVIDDVMIFNRLLSAEEAGQLYEGGL